MADTTDTRDLTTSEVAELLRVHENSVYRWINAGKFPGAYRLPGYRAGWRIPQAGLDDFRRQREVAS